MNCHSGRDSGRRPTHVGSELIVIVHLVNPTEKFWGVLLNLDPAA